MTELHAAGQDDWFYFLSDPAVRATERVIAVYEVEWSECTVCGEPRDAISGCDICRCTIHDLRKAVQ